MQKNSTTHEISNRRRICLACIVSFCLSGIVACGGGSDSGGETDNSGSSENTAPSAAIINPLNGEIYTYGDTITFLGLGTDAEDGELSGSSLLWTSDIDDAIGNGTSFSLSNLSTGDHIITLTATDSNAATGNDNIYISVKGWTHPADLNNSISPDGQSANYPQVAMDDNGNAVITWNQYDGSNWQVFISEYRDGAWSHPTSLTDNISPNGEDAFSPQVAMDDNGNAIITWYQFDGSNDQIFMSEYRDGVWTHPASLTDNISPDGQNAEDSQVAMDDNGNAIITWVQSDGSNDHIFMSEYRDGVWTHPTGLSDNISPDGEYTEPPQVAMDDNDNAVITWVQSNGSNLQIFMSEYRDGVWTHPSSLTDNISPDGQNAEYPQVAMDDNGNATITWSQYDDGSFDTQIFISEYRNGAWDHPDSLTDNISSDGQNANSPQVAMDDNGSAVITWNQYDGSNWQIFMSEYRDGVWTHPTDLTDSISLDGQNAYNSQVAMDDNGNAIITWRQSDGSNWQIFMSECRDGAWAHPTSLTDNISPDGEYSEYPQVAMDNIGNAIITWYQWYGSDSQIFMSMYY